MTKVKESFSGVSNSTEHIPTSKKNKNCFLALVASLLVVATIIGIVVGVYLRKNSNTEHPQPDTIIKQACSCTLYPELCYSAISKFSGATKKITCQKDVIETLLTITVGVAKGSLSKIEEFLKLKSLVEQEKPPLDDCLETLDETLDELYEVMEDLNVYPNNKTLSQHADDLKTLMSAAMTNLDTCLDGASSGKVDKMIRAALLEVQEQAERMCSNALAMITNMTETDIAKEKMSKGDRKLMEDSTEEEIHWPEWLSAKDRRLLQSSSVVPNTVVAQDGSGNYQTVQEAVAAVPDNNNRRYVIKIKAGVYKENVEVSKKKKYLMFMGDGKNNTIITAFRNVVNGSTTFNSATVAAVGKGFLARDITFENTAGPANHQAVALRVGSDLSAFYQCDILGYQDTLYVHSNRQFFINCVIAGTVDFIFGNAAVVLQDCDIQARKPGPRQKNIVTAQGRTDPYQNTGIVLLKCRISATSDLEPVKSDFLTYLGRPWKEYSRTVVMQSTISDVIAPAGWLEWNGTFALATLVYREYQNIGPGADTSGRVKWKGYKVITNITEAESYTPRKFIDGDRWLNSTGFPFSLDL